MRTDQQSKQSADKKKVIQKRRTFSGRPERWQRGGVVSLYALYPSPRFVPNDPHKFMDGVPI